ncbi:hypothetical protein Moror_390 [Moniliophthora roreri MCA 2997]|uniref:Uncharacterized protein n=1 Tax=Moniliophthora roreri (strain MCA 2997) TaxID=1381753 RepID=V2Z2G5_MONRO|nr:hypothetical protein Moror_390 [Moniliophthora roreri MCA 2997]
MSAAAVVRFVDLAKPPKDRVRMAGLVYPNVAQSKSVPDRKQSQDLWWKFKTLSAASLEDLGETSPRPDEDPLPEVLVMVSHHTPSKLARLTYPMTSPVKRMLLCSPSTHCPSQTSLTSTEISSNYSSSSSGSEC